jgi:Mn-dependent DtxR family transcriptional regulator
MKDKHILTKSQSDYLKMVYLLACDGQVRVTDIAKKISVSKPTVVNALKILKKKELVEYSRYQHIILTKKGYTLAIEIRERGLLLSIFLQYVVGVDEKNAEKDAGKLEYIISEETMEKVKRMLPVCNAHKNIRNLPHIQNISAIQRSI